MLILTLGSRRAATVSRNEVLYMVEFSRKKGESFESFLRRFNKRLQQSRKLQEARKRQHVVSKKSRNLQKKSALIGLEIKSQKEYLKKIGKLKEENTRRW
jgi:ribosomal protein S21